MEIGVGNWLLVNDHMILKVHDTSVMAESNAAIFICTCFSNWYVHEGLGVTLWDCCCVEQWPKQLNADISEVDPEIVDIIEHEKNRQWKVWNQRTKRWALPIEEFKHLWTACNLRLLTYAFVCTTKKVKYQNVRYINLMIRIWRFVLYVLSSLEL